MLRAKLAYAHDWVSDPNLSAVFETLPGSNFVVAGATPAHDSALASAGAALRLANGTVVGAKFDGEFTTRGQTLRRNRNGALYVVIVSRIWSAGFSGAQCGILQLRR